MLSAVEERVDLAEDDASRHQPARNDDQHSRIGIGWRPRRWPDMRESSFSRLHGSLRQPRGVSHYGVEHPVLMARELGP